LVLGFGLDKILHRTNRAAEAMGVSIGVVLLSAGVSITMGFSLILTCLVMGMMVANRHKPHSRHIRHTVEQAGPVIFVLFFTLIGARFQISQLPAMGLIGIMYVVARSVGKLAGAWLGGNISNSSKLVRDNLGFGLMAQAGIAIGLSLAASRRFTGLGDEGAAFGALIISTITATTFIVQLFGPLSIKFAIHRAGEIGKAILPTEDEEIQTI
jgi:Kef-type K+ transport system membrane component KefB